MDFPERFSNLPEYAFPRLRSLLDKYPPGGEVLSMSVGSPKHEFPIWIKDILEQNIHELKEYPPNDGSIELLKSIGCWLNKRYNLSVDCMAEIMALNGTRAVSYTHLTLPTKA